MAVAGFAFYQGEANTASAATADQYGCLFPQMITAWRDAFQAPAAWFGFIQLSTWCALPPDSLPQMREAQMSALQLPNVGYATNADHGMGCNIHPAAKQYCAKRLANAALSMQYNHSVAWKSPTYSTAAQVQCPEDTSSVCVAVELNDVSSAGLHTLHPWNYKSQGYGPESTQIPTVVDCTASFPVNATTNSSMSEQCAWAALQVDQIGWLNATASVDQTGQALYLTAKLPKAMARSGSAVVVASSYGWGPIPMINAYDRSTGLPVLPWNRACKR